MVCHRNAGSVLSSHLASCHCHESTCALANPCTIRAAFPTDHPMEGDAWYFVHQGQQQGPVDGKGLLELVLQGVLNESTQVWSEGMGENGWARLVDTALADSLPPGKE